MSKHHQQQREAASGPSPGIPGRLLLRWLVGHGMDAAQQQVLRCPGPDAS